MKGKQGETKKDEIKNDLIDQLERNGTFGVYYTDLVDDYMGFWAVKDGLKADIAVRGTKVSKMDSRGQKQISNNESIDILIKVNTQMLKILDALGLKAVEAESTNGGEDDVL